MANTNLKIIDNYEWYYEGFCPSKSFESLEAIYKDIDRERTEIKEKHAKGVMSAENVSYWLEREIFVQRKITIIESIDIEL